MLKSNNTSVEEMGYIMFKRASFFFFFLNKIVTEVSSSNVPNFYGLSSNEATLPFFSSLISSYILPSFCMRSLLSCSSHLGHGFPIWHLAHSFNFKTFAFPHTFILLLVNLYSIVFICFLFSLIYRSHFLADTLFFLMLLLGPPIALPGNFYVF